MSDEVETMAWTGAKPWHGLGNEVSNDLTAEQMLKAAGLDWAVGLQPIFYEKGGKMLKVPNKSVLVRDKDGKVLTITGEGWKPVQNAAAMEFFREFVIAGDMTLEVAGSLAGGQYIWALARVGKNVNVGKGDAIGSFVLLMSPHVHGKAMIIQYTNVRVVCWNTLSMALGDHLRGSRSAFRMPHTMTFNDKMKETAKQVLGLATKQATEFKEAAVLLSKKSISDEEADEFFMEVLKFEPTKAKKKKDGSVREPKKLEMFRDALEAAPGAQLITARGTLWGALNAVTAVIDHQVGKERETALRNAWIGHTAGIKLRALDLALKLAK